MRDEAVTICHLVEVQNIWLLLVFWDNGYDGSQALEIMMGFDLMLFGLRVSYTK